MTIVEIKPNPTPVVRCELTQTEVNVLAAIKGKIGGSPDHGKPRQVLCDLLEQFKIHATRSDLNVNGSIMMEGTP